MTLARWSVSLIVMVGLLAAAVAASVVWLLVTDPVAASDKFQAVATGDFGPVVEAIGVVLYDALRGLFKYL
jgi:hypothetical protein